MKNRLHLLTISVIMIVLAACGSNQDQKESGVQAGQMEPEYGAMEGTDSETAENGETAFSAEPVYEADILRYSEPSGTFSFRKDVEKTQTDYAAYYFESFISEKERRACIAATERMLSGIRTTVPEIEIVVLSPESYDGILISGNRLYTPVQAWDSADYLAKVLLAGYGEWSNYGLAYGYADYLYGKAGVGEVGISHNNRERASDDGSEMPDDREEALSDIEPVSDDRESHGFLPTSASEVYDLTLLCFDERFVAAQDVEAAKNNACLFVEEYLSSHSEEELLELLSASGTAEGLERVNGVLEEFYVENGVDCTLTRIRYQYGGVTFDYAVACEYARFYIDKDWQEQYWEANPMITENFLHENYGEVRQFFECNAKQMGQYQEFFDFAKYHNELIIFFTNKWNNPSKYNGIYYPDSHTIYLRAVMSLMHEYIHSVTYGNIDWRWLWKREGCARYFSYKYDAYYCEFYEGLLKYYGDDEHAQEVFDSLGSYLGRMPDARTDMQAIVDISVYIWGATDPDMSYDAASSFIGYLVDQYGEREVIQYICSDNLYNEEWGKSYEELVQDWNEYLEENYSWYERK